MSLKLVYFPSRIRGELSRVVMATVGSNSICI